MNLIKAKTTKDEDCYLNVDAISVIRHQYSGEAEYTEVLCGGGLIKLATKSGKFVNKLRESGFLPDGIIEL